MADIRIKDLATTASVTASDDFMAVDGAINGTRKLSAATPSFLTSVTTPSLTSPAATPLTLGTTDSGAAITVLSADNNVGIGTTSPAAKLDVRTVYGLDGLRVYDRNATLAVSVDQYGGLTAAAGIVNNTGAYASASDGTALTFSEGASEKARIDTAGNLLVGSITTNGTASPTAISVVGRLRSFQGSASVANTAYVDVPLSMPRGLIGYFVMSDGNSGHQSAGFFRANNNGASSSYTLFGQSENLVAVTVPSNGNIRITNNTGGTVTLTYSFTMIVGQ
jgi:hypothetical protein